MRMSGMVVRCVPVAYDVVDPDLPGHAVVIRKVHELGRHGADVAPNETHRVLAGERPDRFQERDLSGVGSANASNAFRSMSVVVASASGS